MPENAPNQTPRFKTKTNPKQQTYNERERAELELLRERLRKEGEEDLLAKIATCQRPLTLKCQTCGTRKEVVQRCKRKWCPCCAKQLAATRARELNYIVERMRWPLFVTLTMRHDSRPSPGEVRKLILCFGKFRRRKLWTCRTKGGVASVELTNDDGGWHPHLHAVIDCQWLAIKTPAPRPRDTKERIKELCSAAQKELSIAWGKQVGQESASVWVKRAQRDTIAKEVVKYTVKAQDLIDSEHSAGDMIRTLDKTRALKTFGEAHGQVVKDIRKDAKAAARGELREWREAMAETDCCPAPDLTPWGGIQEEQAQGRRHRESQHLTCIGIV